MKDSIKYWVVVIYDDDYSEIERHYFRTEEKARELFGEISENWQKSKHTRNLKTWGA